MSILYKVLILFLISFSLMIFVSNKTDTLTQNSMKSLIKEKYIQASNELFKDLSNNNKEALNKKLKALKFKIVLNKQHYFDLSKTIYSYETELSTIKILQYEDSRYLLYMIHFWIGI